MKRREFIKLCSASIALAALPVTLLAKLSFDPTEITWMAQEFDWGTKYGLAGQIIRGGKKYRHGILFPQSKTDLTPENIDEGKYLIIEHFKQKILI